MQATRRSIARLAGCLAAACLSASAARAAGGLAVAEDAASGRYTVTDGGRPVLVYNFGLVPVPAGVSGKYAVARGDYVHPLYGPEGEVLTKDYSPDHPHHRGLYWAWPEVTWKGETRDLHALQGVFARPVRIARQEAAGGCAVLEAESVWKWGDAEPIVGERATISVAPLKEGRRAIDFALRFEALADGVTLARRGRSHYGGFNCRLSARASQTIVTHADTNRSPAEAWACLTGVPPLGKGPVSVVLLQDPANPGYPGDWVQYPNLNWLQPTFPASGTAFELRRGQPLTLRFRVVVSAAEPSAETLRLLAAEYAESLKLAARMSPAGDAARRNTP
jgi:hypothetical protein